jgi:hypothetical protein
MTTVSLVVHDSLNLTRVPNGDYLTLFFPKKKITVHQLIIERVRQEVKKFDPDSKIVYHGLVMPTDSEQVLNGVKVKRHNPIDVEIQCQVALNGFKNNGFILLVDDRQVQDLNETIEITSDTSVVFLKLTPLVGG